MSAAGGTGAFSAHFMALARLHGVAIAIIESGNLDALRAAVSECDATLAALPQRPAS